jgi:hypothetical protein
VNGGSDRGGLWGPEPTPAQLAEARIVGDAAVAAALARVLDGALSTGQAAARLGVSPASFETRVRARQLLVLQSDAGWRCPAWQFGDDGSLPGVGELIAVWPGSPLALSMWATTPSADLGGRTPADALTSQGGPRRVIELVEAIAAAAW